MGLINGTLHVRMELRAGRSLDAVIRPEDLIAIRHRHSFIWMSTGVTARKREMAGRMPILSYDDVLETRSKHSDPSHDLVSVHDGKTAARAEVNLRINDDQGVRRPDCFVIGDLLSAQYHLLQS